MLVQSLLKCWNCQLLILCAIISYCYVNVCGQRWKKSLYHIFSFKLCDKTYISSCAFVLLLAHKPTKECSHCYVSVAVMCNAVSCRTSCSVHCYLILMSRYPSCATLSHYYVALAVLCNVYVALSCALPSHCFVTVDALRNAFSLCRTSCSLYYLIVMLCHTSCSVHCYLIVVWHWPK